MKLALARDNLLRGLQTIYPIVPIRGTLPILTHILLEAKKETIQMTATDLELGISTILPAEVAEEGAVAIPAKRFYELVKELPNETLHLSAKKNQQLSLECGKRLFKIMGLPKEEFPHLPTPNNTAGIVIDQPVLQAMLSLTTFAVSKDENRYVLTGVLFTTQNGWLRLVSTDGRRMAMVEREAKTGGEAEQQRVVPEKALGDLSRLLEENATVKITLRDNQIGFDLGNTFLVTRLIEGKFPNYEQVIPTQSPNKLIAQREEFLMAARRISLWTTPESPSIRLELKPDKLILSKQTPEVGEAQEEIQVKYRGPEFSIGFNPTYLIDVLKVLSDGHVELELPGSEKPAVIRTKDHYLYVVLPMQLTS